MNSQVDAQESNGGVENLRQIVKQLPGKQKLQHDDFVYGESDDTDIEINDFFNYNEVPGFCEYQLLFDEHKPDGWSSMNHLQRKNYVYHLLNDLEHSVQEVRLDAGKRLLYIAQGEFGDAEILNCTGDDRENHLKRIKENNSLLQQCGAVAIIYNVLRKACEEHDRQNNPSNLQDTNEEIGISLTILFLLLETLRTEASLFSDLENLDQPLLVFLFGLMSQLREKNLKMFPVKKLLLVVWKALLASFGGQEDIDRIRNTIRKTFQLPAVKLNELQTRSTPHDLHTFAQEIVQKYPTYSGPPYPEHVEQPELIKPTAALSAMLGSNGSVQGNGSDMSKSHPNMGKNANLGQQGKRQNNSVLSQNVQKEPFILPFSSWDMDVPKSIQEAGEMYSRHMYVSLATLQILKERERARRKSVISNDEDGFEFILRCKDKMSNLASEDEHTALTREELEAFRRLNMIESLYKSIVPNLQNIIIVLLKLLLATVTTYNSSSASNNNHNNDNSPDRGGISADATEATQKHDSDEADAKRNREITSKSVSGILFLLLRWTKLSHVLKFENISQLLVDSGCLLLILKILGLQDMAITLTEQSDHQERNFFNYWSIQRRKKLKEHDVNAQIPDKPIMKYQHTNWRNMFWCINFLRIMQKLTKRKTHRIMLLVQYKSSAILKRFLKVSNPMLELYTLKVLKNQVPYLGRKWRSSKCNMRIITAIYLTCRPALREEWMTGLESESDVDESALQESNLRTLIKAYHTRRYLPTIPSMQRRLEGTNMVGNYIYDPSAVATDPSSLFSSPLDDNEEVELDSAFMHNYEQWLEDEVYSVPSSPDISATESFTNDYLVSPALSDSPIYQFYQDEERHAAARHVSELYRSALDLEFNFNSSDNDNGWDAPVQFIRSYDPQLDDINFDADFEDTTNDPLSHIDWTSLNEEDLQERLRRIERQTIQRRLRTDDENDHKILNAFEDLAIDNEEWDAP